MGVGNWSWNPSSGMSEFTVHVDELRAVVETTAELSSR